MHADERGRLKDSSSAQKTAGHSTVIIDDMSACIKAQSQFASSHSMLVRSQQQSVLVAKLCLTPGVDARWHQHHYNRYAYAYCRHSQRKSAWKHSPGPRASFATIVQPGTPSRQSRPPPRPQWPLCCPRTRIGSGPLRSVCMDGVRTEKV